MRKSFTAIAVVVVIMSTISYPALAITKPGTACGKVGLTSIAGGKKFTCIKSSKKLIWDKGTLVVVPDVKPSASPIPAPSSAAPLGTLNSQSNSQSTNAVQPSAPTTNLSDTSLFSNLEKCKIIDGDPQTTNMTAGFPIPDGRIDLIKGAKVQIIGVDFPDKTGGSNTPQKLYENLTASVEKFWSAQSSIPTRFDWNWRSDWVRMPNSINSYSLGGSFFQGKFDSNAYRNFAKEIISKTDSSIDFTGVNFLFIVFPLGVTSDEIGTFVVDTQVTNATAEVNIRNLIIAGGDYNNSRTYIHEFGHSLGLTDIRDTVDVGNQKSDGMYYDIMNNNEYPELLVWHRFLLGFLENSQIHCINSTETSTHWLVPVESTGKPVKGIVIPLSSTEAIIVESRRALGFDTALASRNDLVGAVVYALDSKIPYHRSPVKVIKVLKNGESVSLNGYKISNVESGTFGDVVKVEKD
jgi:M6 family metalloprotease-like protein